MKWEENFIYVSVQNFVEVTAIQSEQVHIGHTETRTYTHDDLIQIRENCTHDNSYKGLGCDTCRNVRKPTLNRRIARGLRLKLNQHRRQ